MIQLSHSARRALALLLLTAAMLSLSACGADGRETQDATIPVMTLDIPDDTLPAGTTAPATEPAATTAAQPAGRLIVIDAGHQAHANTDKEPLGPGSTEMKTKVASGTQGVSSGVPEYEVNLAVALKLETILTERGYEVEMIRRTNDVNISNAERAQTANDLGADAFIRLHCNGVTSSEVKGALIVIQSPQNPYNGHLYSSFKKLAQAVLNGLCEATGAVNKGLQEMDNMTGINWCQVPTALVEMGFMTNPEEDLLLTDDVYQQKLAEGIANGLDSYFASL